MNTIKDLLANYFYTMLIRRNLIWYLNNTATVWDYVRLFSREWGWVNTKYLCLQSQKIYHWLGITSAEKNPRRNLKRVWLKLQYFHAIMRKKASFLHRMHAGSRNCIFRTLARRHYRLLLWHMVKITIGVTNLSNYYIGTKH